MHHSVQELQIIKYFILVAELESPRHGTYILYVATLYVTIIKMFICIIIDKGHIAVLLYIVSYFYRNKY